MDTLTADKEVRDRVRRIETRLTKLMGHLGFDPKGSMPVWNNGSVEIPSLAVALKDVLSVVPDDWWAGFWVMHKGEYVCFMKGEKE